MAVAKLLEKRVHQVSGKFQVSELFFEVPKDYSKPSDGSLQLFARSVERFENPVELGKERQKKSPWFAYLQGGPGVSCGPPQSFPWTNIVLDKGYQILFLDQRGTGLSSTVTARTLALQGSPTEQAEYLKHFRADSIVRDCEAIRKNLTAKYPEGQRKWSIMGQSFGGFCSVSYLSRFPEGLREVFTCGGLPPLVNQPDEVYRKLYGNVVERNRLYYQKFPEDVQPVKNIYRVLSDTHVRLPSGGDMTAARFRQMGLYFGFHGGMDIVHDVVLRCTSDLDQFGFLTRPTLSGLDNILGFDSKVIYALLHEAIYCQGAASNWSAERMIAGYPEFDYSPEIGEPFYFTGEMVSVGEDWQETEVVQSPRGSPQSAKTLVKGRLTTSQMFRHMLDSYPELDTLRETAEILAKVDDWPDLYDEAQLAKNEVPVYSATYVDDMYVHFDYARQTASKIRNCKHFITNIWYHDALRGKSDELMKQLFALRDDVID